MHGSLWHESGQQKSERLSEWVSQCFDTLSCGGGGNRVVMSICRDLLSCPYNSVLHVPSISVRNFDLAGEKRRFG